MKYLFLFVLFFFWQEDILASDQIIITPVKEKKDPYFANKKRQSIIELLKGTDIESYVENEECALFQIINHITECACFNEDLVEHYFNDFFSHNFGAFRALFIIPDEKSVLSNLHRAFIINLSCYNLIEFTKKTEKTDLRLQLWIFTRLMDLYTHQMYNEAKNREKKKKSDIRIAIVDLGKKIDLANPLTNSNKESQKSGIDYVGLIFKAINLINYLPNATEESFYLTTLLNDIKIRLDMYVNQIRGNKENEKADYISNILDWYTNFSQTKYATRFNTLQPAIKSIHDDIKYKKKPLFTKDRFIFLFIAACSGVIANYGLKKTFILLKRLKRKIQTALRTSENDHVK